MVAARRKTVPMRVAVISDIHGNWHALEAVLAEVERERPDLVWCLGDLVGYGPQPNACCREVAARAHVCLVGNHDLAVLGALELAEFAPDAAHAAEWTRAVLSDEARRYLARLEPSAVAEGIELYHGSPRDPVWEYVLSADVALASLRRTAAPVVLVGHSHVALAIGLGEDGAEGGLAPDGTEVKVSGGRWLLNPGSVGQPRDGDPRAAYLLLDLGGGRARFRRVAYAVERTQAEIREARLPDALADRLDYGG